MTIIYRSIFEGHEDFIRISKIALLNSLLVFIFVVIAYLFHLHIIFFAVLNLIAALVQFGNYCFAFSKHYCNLKIKYSFVNIVTFKEIFKFSISVQAAFLLGSLIDPVIKYIIGNYSENKLIPPYEIARRFSNAISGLYTFSFKNAFPRISKLSTKIEYENFLSLDGIKLSKLGISFSGLFFGVFSILFICIFKWFYGYNESIIIFLILALVESFNNTGYILYVFILGIGRASFLAMIQALNVASIAVLSIVCLLLFHNELGLLGLYISVIFANIIMLLIIKKYVGLNILSFYKKINFLKLVCLNLLILIDIAVLTYKMDLWMISQISLSIICLWLFRDDVKIPIKIIQGIVNNRRQESSAS
jgi:O-antigen/teichoic acid export membrane protein